MSVVSSGDWEPQVWLEESPDLEYFEKASSNSESLKGDSKAEEPNQHNGTAELN